MRIEQIEFEVDGQKLRGHLYKPESEAKKLALLFIHGWTGKPNDNAAEVLANHGFYAMTFSLSGHNDSDGTMESQTRDKSLKEVLAAYDFFKQRLPEGVQIAPVGNSYGGYMSILLSAERPLTAMSLRVASNYVDDHSNEKQLGQGSENPEVLKWRQLPLDFNATRTLRALHNFTGPIQIMEAELDELVPHQVTMNYLKAAKANKRVEYLVLKNWPHSMGDDPARNKEFQQLLLDWAEKVAEQL